jgi:hypothetical protein
MTLFLMIGGKSIIFFVSALSREMDANNMKCRIVHESQSAVGDLPGPEFDAKRAVYMC